MPKTPADGDLSPDPQGARRLEIDRALHADSLGRCAAQQVSCAARPTFRATCADSPNVGRFCDAIRLGYRKYHEGRHVIFYVLIPQGITVVRILHDSMDAERHL
jgi:plasmid stabilization system protein ParE